MHRSHLRLCGLGLVLAVPLIVTFAETGLVPRFPTAILITGLMIVAALSFAVGLILDTVTRGRRETRRLAYEQAQIRLDATRARAEELVEQLIERLD